MDTANQMTAVVQNAVGDKGYSTPNWRNRAFIHQPQVILRVEYESVKTRPGERPHRG